MQIKQQTYFFVVCLRSWKFWAVGAGGSCALAPFGWRVPSVAEMETFFVGYEKWLIFLLSMIALGFLCVL